MKPRLLLTSALFLFVQIATMQAQETVDIAKITCHQLTMDELAAPMNDVVLWFSGYYNGKRNITVIDLQTMRKNKAKVDTYCYQNPEATVLDAVNKVLGSDK